MTYLDTRPIGTVFTAPYDVVLSDTDIVEPDLLLVLNNSRAASTAARDRELKRKRYERFGVQEYWMVDPDSNTLEILVLKGGPYVELYRATRSAQCSSPLLPGLVLNLDSLLK